MFTMPSLEEIEAETGCLRNCKTDIYSLGFRPEKPNLLSAVKAVKSSNVDVAALTHIIRESQKEVLYGIFSLLGGGHCFEENC